jgi:lysozyme family protein
MKQKQDSGTLTADFNAFLPILLGFEGGYVEDPTDPGGETNKGVTMSTFQQYAQELLGVDPTSDNLKALTDDQAGTIYRTLYWNKIHGDDFASQYLANIVCDFFVNSGTHATKLLQHVLNGLGANLTEDGAIGPGSLNALAAADQTQVYRNYKQGRIDYYTALGAKYPQFVKGWLNRANAFPDL